MKLEQVLYPTMNEWGDGFASEAKFRLTREGDVFVRGASQLSSQYPVIWWTVRLNSGMTSGETE
jgi:hypothetical protein